MVTIIDFKERTNQAGEKFFALIVTGGLEMIRSKETGNFYATARKASVPSTFNEQFCKELIGTKIPGKVERVYCEPYEFQIPDSKEKVTLDYTFRYNAEPSNVAETVFFDQPEEPLESR